MVASTGTCRTTPLRSRGWWRSSRWRWRGALPVPEGPTAIQGWVPGRENSPEVLLLGEHKHLKLFSIIHRHLSWRVVAI